MRRIIKENNEFNMDEYNKNPTAYTSNILIPRVVKEYIDANGEEYEIYANYNDGYDTDSIEQILDSTNPRETFESMIYDDYQDIEWDAISNVRDEISIDLKLIISNNIPEFDFDSLNVDEEIRDEMEKQGFYVSLPFKQILNNSNVNMVISYENEECYIPSEGWNFDNDTLISLDDDGIIWLLNKFGYNEQDFIDYYNSNKNNDKFLDSIIKEFDNLTYSNANIIFLSTLNLGDIIDIQESKTVTIFKGTTCGLFTAYNGSGSVLEIDLPKDLKISNSGIAFYVDGTRGYGVDDTYGLTSSAWGENNFSVL